MCWKLGVTETEALELTWNQIDMEKGTIFLKDRNVSIDDKDLMIRLIQLKEENEGETDPHVVLRPNVKKPYQLNEMSRLVRTLLIRGGVEGMTLVDVTLFMQKKAVSAQIMNYVRSNGSIMRSEVMELLQVTKAQARDKIELLRDEGELVKVGVRYYLPGTVVPPEEHYEVIRTHIEAMGSTYRQEVAELLGIGTTQATTVLRNLVKEGKLDMEGHFYMLPGDEKK
jgi:predicted HTH transcriptional regulator